jgi:hypothetical protein
MTDKYCERSSSRLFQSRPIERHIGTTVFTVGLCNKEYGGPEEGGWYYDTFSPRRVFHIPSEVDEYYVERLERWCERMNQREGRYPPYSVLCLGWWTVQRGAVTSDQPEERPYFS